MSIDWSTPNDFDLEDAAWLDLETIGSRYIEQIDQNSSARRHRLRVPGSPWKRGAAPKKGNCA